MFDPVVITLPTALALIAFLAAIAWAYRRWLERPISYTTRPAAAPRGHRGRHRADDRTEPYRDWAAIAAERMYEDALRQRARERRPDPDRDAGLFGITWDTQEIQLGAAR